jgi:hypothetical protein
VIHGVGVDESRVRACSTTTVEALDCLKLGLDPVIPKQCNPCPPA